MNNPASDSDSDIPRPQHGREYEDPHYHDEEPELSQDDRERRRWPGKRNPARPRLSKRRHQEYEE
jgi:hypothetical protein